MRISDWSSDVCSADLKGKSLMVGEEANHVAMRAASEAVIEALVVVYVEARRLFVVKRAAGLPFPPGADKLDRAPDHARQRHAVAQFVQKGGGDRHPPPLPLKDGAVKGGVLDVPHTTPAPPSPVRLPGSCPSGRRSALSAPPSPGPCP